MKSVCCTIGLLAVLLFAGCSKQVVDITAGHMDTLSRISGPSGVIKEFFVRDTIVAFNKGTVVKWNVTETNSKTVVTINGVKMALYGVFETGPLKQPASYLLALNNGLKQTRTAFVADSITSLMWNEGRRLKQTKSEIYIDTSGHGKEWIDNTTDRILNERTNFFLNGDSRLEQLSTAYEKPKASGVFVVNISQLSFIWRGIVYSIISLNQRQLVVIYDTLNVFRNKVQNRSTYQFE